MRILSIIAAIVACITIILLTVFEKKEKIKQGTMIYRIIEIIGMYIPILVISGYYGYMKTDTLRETIIVIGGIYICLALWTLFLGLWRMKKYNYIMFPIVILSCYFILNFITPYMLASLESRLLLGFVGATLGTSVVNNKYKGRLIISGIIVGLIIITAPTNYLKDFKNNSKVENISFEYVENLGYDITDNDKVIIFDKSTKNNPIRLWLVRKKPDEDWTLMRHIKMTYSNGEIIEFKVEKDLSKEEK
ncbi:MAG: hypothetical protein N4A68_06630 [Maledivibacter sp.]|jgi:hypothetical protein|nr:hypothetical protein [Maledivibacter sp.]